MATTVNLFLQARIICMAILAYFFQWCLIALYIIYMYNNTVVQEDDIGIEREGGGAPTVSFCGHV